MALSEKTDCGLKVTLEATSADTGFYCVTVDPSDIVNKHNGRWSEARAYARQYVGTLRGKLRVAGEYTIDEAADKRSTAVKIVLNNVRDGQDVASDFERAHVETLQSIGEVPPDHTRAGREVGVSVARRPGTW